MQNKPGHFTKTEIFGFIFILISHVRIFFNIKNNSPIARIELLFWRAEEDSNSRPSGP